SGTAADHCALRGWVFASGSARVRVQGHTVMRNLMTGFAALLIAGSIVPAAEAQGPAQFYKGKTVELYIGYSVGGGYDVYARMLARHMGRHIPGNPVIAPKNMPGAGSLTLANWLYGAAPRDGSVFGTIGRGIAFDPLLGT